jgi:non-ribosomal peptide synthetase-like protein
VFIDDFLRIPDNPSARIYRTGDLGRVTEDGEIEYLGRIDRQVKIRGYRIELTEIESVLLGDPDIGAAVVDTYEPEPGTAELVAYCVARAPGVELDPHPIHRRLTENLPAYMVPAYLEQVPAIPLTTSDKADRAALPAPTHRYTAAGEHLPPANDTERALASALAETLNLPEISVTSHFFDELGGSSLLMARFSARAREEGLPPLAIKDIYQHPTVRALASVVTSTDTGAATAAEDADGHTGLPPTEPGEIVRTSTAGYLRTGAAQLLVYLVGALVAGLLLDVGYRWVSGGANWVAVYQRGAVFSTAVFAGVCLLPIALKWCLVGRWTAREIPLWGRGYLRFWLVKTLVRYNPMALFVGSPLYSLYLRALGANIGRNVVVFAPVPVAADLISIGEGTVVRQRSSLSGYRAVAGRIQVGPVTLGNDVVVAENTVLDIDTAMDDGARLGHASALLSGQRVPAGRSWHGSPAEPAGVDYGRVPPARCATPRKIAFTLLQLTGVALGLTTVFGSLALTLSRIPPVARVMGPGAPYVGTPSFYGIVATGVVALFALGLPAGILFMITVPRLLHAFVRPGKVYPLYGIAYLAAQLTEALTNSAFYVLLLGDSSFITRFARLVGYDLSRLVQTGSNFGTQHRHDSPYLTKVGSGTMISDGLAVINAEYSNTSFRLDPVVIGERNFLGNNLAYPAGARAGDNVLLATKAMVPIDGPVRDDVGLLGSPPIVIPRRTWNVGSDKPRLPTDDEELARGLARKNGYNARTIAVVLAARCLGVVVGVVPLAIAADLWWRYGALALGGAFFVAGWVLLGYAALLERVVVWLHPLRPRHCTIYDPDFWHQERLWKFHLSPPLQGTPFQVLIWRVAGLRVGHRVFDDGCAFPEKALTTVGDDAVLNAGTVVQCHSLEDGYFVRDRATVGRSAVLGVNAFMHYGTTLGEGTVLDADSYLLKGEQVAPGEHWGGNPASLRRTVSSTPERTTTHDGRPRRRLCH